MFCYISAGTVPCSTKINSQNGCNYFGNGDNEITTGSFSQDNHSLEFIAITAYCESESSFNLWVLGMTGKTFDIIAFHTVVVKNARISYDVAVAKLSESETEVPTLLVAYSYIDDGDMSMSSVNVQFKSYQIKGLKLYCACIHLIS